MSDTARKLVYVDQVRRAILRADPSIVYVLNNVPVVDAVEVVHSAWTLHKSGNGTCKHCNRTTIAAWDYDSCMRYCPSCGAKMDGDCDVCDY